MANLIDSLIYFVLAYILLFHAPQALKRSKRYTKEQIETWVILSRIGGVIELFLGIVKLW